MFEKFLSRDTFCWIVCPLLPFSFSSQSETLKLRTFRVKFVTKKKPVMKFGSYPFSFFVIYILYIIATKTVCFNEPGYFSLRNISTLYRGTWSLLPRNLMMNMTDYQSLNFDLKTTSSVDGVQLFQRRMKFSKMGGNVVFEIASTKTEIEEMDKIEVGDRFGVLYVEHQF